MRIVCTVTNDLSHDQRMHRICGTLTAAGHEVTLVGRSLPGSPALTDRPYRQYRIDCRYHHGKLFYLEYNYRLWRTLRNRSFDCLNSVDLDTLAAGYLLGKDRWVFDAHEWFSETPEVVNRPFVRWAWRTLGKWLVSRTTARYTVAKILSEKLSDEYGVEFGVVRSLPLRRRGGIDSPGPGAVPLAKGNESSGLFPASPEDSLQIARGTAPGAIPGTAKKILLYQGMLNPGRGLDVAIRTLAELPDHVLWLVGSGPEEAALRRLAEELEVTQRVIFHGFQPPEKLPAFTRAAWLGLNLLDAISPSYYYSLANKAVDYIQDGLPSVQMNFPEYRSIQETHDCYVLVDTLHPPDSYRDIARAILSITPERYAELRQNCERAAEILCWERETEALLSFYQ